MKKQTNLAARLMSKLAMRAAKSAAGTASAGGMCQPKEPAKLARK